MVSGVVFASGVVVVFSVVVCTIWILQGVLYSSQPVRQKEVGVTPVSGGYVCHGLTRSGSVSHAHRVIAHDQHL